MTTDDERRLVAESLRMADVRDAAGLDCLLANAVRGYYFCKTPCESCHRRLLAELADLIEPEERKGIESEAFDREALLELADEMERRAPYALHGGWRDSLRDYARRIREACGVVA